MTQSDDFRANPFTAPEADLNAVSGNDSHHGFVYANVWQRFCACVVDNILRYVILVLASFGAGATLGLAGGMKYAELVGGSIGLIVPWLYWALQESSVARATLGQRAMNLKVVDQFGKQVSFGRATGRYFGKIISTLLLGIGYLMQPFTENRQALHDMLSDCLVIRD